MSNLSVDNITTKTISANGTIGSSGQYLTANGTGSFWSTPKATVGVNQTWQDVTSSRALATDYTNTTGAPIMVCVTGLNSGTASKGTITAVVDGINITRSSTGDDEGVQAVTGYGSISFIVPNGSIYRVNQSASTLDSWAELR